ncbi:MAG: hypothetical protein H7641_03790 [Candidatus Heimdallarchaeota archaeon]|nr:hypothetical protein [Candidatus Heimdallarchaeota archaeon]
MSQKVSLEECLVDGDTGVITKFCVDYFKNCDFTTDYKIEAVCQNGLAKLFCGYFKGQYGIVAVEIIGLYPNEVEDIENDLILVIEEKIRSIPRKKGLQNFNYEIGTNRVVLRFYACETEVCDEKEGILQSLEKLSPALEFLADYLRKRRIR